MDKNAWLHERVCESLGRLRHAPSNEKSRPGQRDGSVGVDVARLALDLMSRCMAEFLATRASPLLQKVGRCLLGLVPQRSVSLLRRGDIMALVMTYERVDGGARKPCHGGAGGGQGGGGPTRRPHEEEASAAPRRLGR